MSQCELHLLHTTAAPMRPQRWGGGFINISYYCKSARSTAFTGHPPYPHLTSRRLRLGLATQGHSMSQLLAIPVSSLSKLYISLHVTIISTPQREFPRPSKDGSPVPARTGCSTPKSPEVPWQEGSSYWLGLLPTRTCPSAPELSSVLACTFHMLGEALFWQMVSRRPYAWGS